MPNLVLYYKPECPFCQRVTRFMERNNIEIPMKNIKADAGAQEELLELGGQDQVPMLLIDGKPMYESLDIIHYLEENCKEAK